jgi:RNA polymerase sigma-19 factor, ECF subfamily
MYLLTTYSDDQLVSLLQQSNEAAFTEIYNRYWKSLYTSAHNILQLNHTAQDAVQEVFISLWNRRDAVKIDSLKPYLFQSVRFQIFKAIRAEKTDNNFFKRLSMVSEHIYNEDPILSKELSRFYKQVLLSLPEDEREIFRMHRDDGLTYKQIAELKNISVKTVEKKMSHVLKQLRLGLNHTIKTFIFLELIKSLL